jgi:hypothetical protein
MSESTIRAGILASLATVSGIKSNLGEWPTSMAVPGLFTLMAEITYPVTAGWNVDLYGFETNLLVAWQDNGVAENTLIAFTPLIKAALKPGRALDETTGAFISGSVGVVPRFYIISGTTYAARTFRYTVKETNG